MVEFVSDRISYITLKGRRCVIILNVHARTKDKDNITYSFYKELEQVFDQVPTNHTKFLLGYLNAMVGRVGGRIFLNQ
jgi:hypothetical protein